MYKNACVAVLLLSNVAWGAAGPKKLDLKIKDHQLNGVVVVSTGQTAIGAEVTLLDQQGRKLQTVKTNEKGEFQFAKAQPGAYFFQVGEQVTPIRAWQPHLAPPSAGEQLLLLTGDSHVARGQLFTGISTTTLVTGAVVAGTVATVVVTTVTNDSGS